MNIIRLELEGIGPFASKQVVDFTELGAGGLFLLEGPTGSGKSTVLDAIVFALYGDVAAGDDSSKMRIVSTYLPADVRPFVELTVETSRGILRVRREPEFVRTKLRGTGETKEKASIRLWKLDDIDDRVGVPISSNIQEANDELQRAIGLTKDQFTQTVVLPQNHFAAFLKAKPEDRRKILQDIFGTRLYDRMKDELVDLSKVLGKRTENASREVSEVAHLFIHSLSRKDRNASGAGGEASEPGPDGAESSTDDEVFDRLISEASGFDGLVEAGGERVRLLRERSDGVSTAVDKANQALSEASEDLATARERNAAIEERGRLLLQQAGLEDERPRINEHDERRGRAERAESLRHYVEEWEAAAEALREATERQDEVRAEVGAVGHQDLVALTEVTALEQAAREAADDAARLEILAVSEARLQEDMDAFSRDMESLEKDRGRLKSDQETLKAERVRVDDFTQEISRLRAEAEGLSEAVLAEEAQRAVRDAADEGLRLQQVLEAQIGQEEGLRIQAGEAASAYEAARGRWLASLAGTLAKELQDGEPCAVCGSPVHPAPAPLAADVPDEGEVRRLEGESAGCRDAVQALAKDSEHTASLLEAEKLKAQHLSAEEAGRRYEEAHALVTELKAAGDRAALLEQEQSELAKSLERQLAVLVDRENEVAGRTGELNARRQQLDTRRAAIEVERGDFPSVTERCRALLAREADARKLADCARLLAVATESEYGRRKALDEALADSEFADEAAVRTALLSELERASLRRLVEDHGGKVREVEALLAQERLTAVEGQDPVDLVPLERAAENASTAYEEAVAERRSHRDRLSASERALGNLEKAVDAYRKEAKAALPYRRMADLVAAGSGNELRMTLPTFVLIRRFEEVVDMANLRLNSMTDGRYSLRRTEGKEGRELQFGLGLEVVDHAADDRTRDPKTLSGGETFKASLAMALGLADAVSAEAGGIELNTLFVDEGFGSLDPGSLDSVMDQLGRLRANGRTVGVISHVAEMKQRIHDRLTAKPNGDGTSVLVSSASSG